MAPAHTTCLTAIDRGGAAIERLRSPFAGRRTVPVPPEVSR